MPYIQLCPIFFFWCSYPNGLFFKSWFTASRFWVSSCVWGWVLGIAERDYLGAGALRWLIMLGAMLLFRRQWESGSCVLLLPSSPLPPPPTGSCLRTGTCELPKRPSKNSVCQPRGVWYELILNSEGFCIEFLKWKMEGDVLNHCRKSGNIEIKLKFIY